MFVGRLAGRVALVGLCGASLAGCGSSSAGGSAISDVSDAKKAVIQIIAQGSFVDPESGQQQTKVGAGSGFIIDQSGLAVTNQHVVDGAGSLDVFVGGSSKAINAKILGVSECNDLAVIDLEGDGYDYFEWFDGDLQPGLEVFAAGFPLGDPEYTLTDGIIAKAEADGDTFWASLSYAVEHSANTQPGNSGGPLLTADGKVAAVNYAGGSPTNTEQFFAIPNEIAQPVVDVLRTGVDQDSIGINGGVLWNEEQERGGLWVSGVRAGSPAANAGVLAGDFVLQMQGREVVGEYDKASKKGYCDVLRTVGSDKPMSITVYRQSTGETLVGEVNNPQRPLEVTNKISSAGGDEDPTTSPVTETTSIDDALDIVTVEFPKGWVAKTDKGSSTNFPSYSLIVASPSGETPDTATGVGGLYVLVFPNRSSKADVATIQSVVVDIAQVDGGCKSPETADSAPVEWDSGSYMAAQWFECGPGALSAYAQVFSDVEKDIVIAFLGIYGGDSGIGNDVINALLDNLSYG